MVANGRNYKYGLIACHDGRIYKYNINGEINPAMYYSAVAKLDSAGYNEDSLNIFCKTVKEAGVDMEVL